MCSVCVCVCECEFEREREIETEKELGWLHLKRKETGGPGRGNVTVGSHIPPGSLGQLLGEDDT